MVRRTHPIRGTNYILHENAIENARRLASEDMASATLNSVLAIGAALKKGARPEEVARMRGRTAAQGVIDVAVGNGLAREGSEPEFAEKVHSHMSFASRHEGYEAEGVQAYLEHLRDLEILEEIQEKKKQS